MAASQSAPREFDFSGPLFETDEAAAYLKYRGKHARHSLLKFVAMKAVPTSRRFRRLLIKKSDLDRAIGATQVR